MGRGDSRTKKGKIFQGSFGNTRPQRVKEGAAVAVAEKPAKAAKKAPKAKKEA